MSQVSYQLYDVSVEAILREFHLHLKHTFGQSVHYVGTTTRLDAPVHELHDIDVLVVLNSLNEAHASYLWRIINRLRAKYNVVFDCRTHAVSELQHFPIINAYLLKLFLVDVFGHNPFAARTFTNTVLRREAATRIKDQEANIIASIPRLPGSPDQIRAIAQSAFDAIRAYLIIAGQPAASKEDAAKRIASLSPFFAEVSPIYDAYRNPDAIVDVGSFVVDALAIVKHLSYRTCKHPRSNTVLLVNTPSSIMPHPRDDYLSYDQNMPLGIVCLASYLKEAGIEVEVLDAYAENLGALSVVDNIFEREHLPHLIGFNSASPNIHVVHKIATYIRRICDDVVLICGGPHASLATEHTLSTGAIDYVVAGEGERPLLRLAKALLSGKRRKVHPESIPGVYALVSDKVVGIPNSDLLDLTAIPEPDFSVLPLARYFAVRRRLYLHTSRGCAFNCIYCSVPACWGKKVREIPSERLVGHLESVAKRHSAKEVQIVDDNFSHKNGKLIRTFCTAMLARKLSIRWKCQARSDQLSQDLVALMAEAGCFEVDLGIESGNKEIQKYIRKNIDLDRTPDIVEHLNKAGIVCKAFFMLGFPGESLSQMTDTINYAIALKDRGLKDVAFFPVMPFPGTEIARKTGKTVFQGAVIDQIDLGERSYAASRLRKYSAKPEVSLNEHLSPDELRLLVKFAYQRFELRVPVVDLASAFADFVAMEEGASYGV
jgi:radical SAM superfamily enzyme YgiQ (UPF0313 family)